MPYYFGEDDSNWEAQMDAQEQAYTEGKDLSTPLHLFHYLEPWGANAAVVSFADAPAVVQASPAVSASKGLPGVLGRIFGSRATGTPVPPDMPDPASDIEDWQDYYTEQQASATALALHSLWEATAAAKAAGVRRVLGSYDGGNDEDFCHLRGFEMADGRTLPARAAPISNGEAIVYHAVTALMGTGYGTGPFELFGAVTVDFDTCTITDEKDRDAAYRFRGEP